MLCPHGSASCTVKKSLNGLSSLWISGCEEVWMSVVFDWTVWRSVTSWCWVVWRCVTFWYLVVWISYQMREVVFSVEENASMSANCVTVSRIFWFLGLHMYLHLRLPHRNDAKIAEICNLWTLILVCKACFWILKRWFISYNYKLKRPEVAGFCYFGIIPMR